MANAQLITPEMLVQKMQVQFSKGVSNECGAGDCGGQCMSSCWNNSPALSPLAQKMKVLERRA